MANTIILHNKTNLKIGKLKKYFKEIISNFKKNIKKSEIKEVKTLNLWNIEIYSEKLKLPKNISWSLILSNLKYISKNIKFPERIWRNLYLENLTEIPEWFKFPKVWWKIYLKNLEKYPKKFSFPKNVIFTYDE